VRISGLLLFAFTAACSKPVQDVPPSPSAPPVASTAPTPAAPSRASLAATLPPDIDIPALKKKLGCAGDVRRQACRLLNDFADATRFTPQIPSGEGRWIGAAYSLEKTGEKSELVVVSVSQTPTSVVPAGELALSIGIGKLPEDKRDHGIKLINALSHGDTVSKLNQAAPYVKTWKPPHAQGTMSTTGVSIRLVNDEAYLRQSSSTRLLLVRLKAHGASGDAADANFAELWAAAW
jgi:hypothetical protein